jgi:hypothetical protein
LAELWRIAQKRETIEDALQVILCANSATSGFIEI